MNQRMSPAQVAQHLEDAIVDSVKDMGGEGAPEGPMYLAFQQIGIDLVTFQLLVGRCIDKKRLTRRGHVLYPVQ